MDACEFERLFKRNVPHILEKIFFSVDYHSFKKCLQVTKSWNSLLTSELFLRRGKYAFCEDIQKDLLQAAERGNVDLIRGVLSNFMVDINFMTESNTSPLIIAACGAGNIHVVQILLDRGAEPNIANNKGRTPLLYAASESHKDVVQLLLDRGAEPNMTNQYGKTALHVAGFMGHKGVVQHLLERGAEPNMADQYGATPLHLAAAGLPAKMWPTVPWKEGLSRPAYNYEDVVHLLLERGAEPNMADQHGRAPLHYATSEGHKDVVQNLLDRGAEPNMAAQNGWTPLHSAANKGHKEVVQLLLDRGAEPNMADQHGRTPLSCALQMGHTDVANILTKNGGAV